MTSMRHAGVVLGLGVLACSEAAPVEPARMEPAAVTPEVEAAGRLVRGFETRDHELWLHAGAPKRYTVKDKQGTVLADAIDGRRLQADYPELFELASGAEDEGSEHALIDVLDY